MAAFPSLTLNAAGEVLLIFRRAPDPRWLFGCDRGDADPSEENADNLAELKHSVYHWDARSHLVAMRIGQDLKKISDLETLSIDGQSADQDASLLLLDCEEILLSSFSWYAMPPAFAKLAKAWGGKAYGGAASTGCSFVEWGSYVRRSCDGGTSWSERDYLPALPGARALVPGLRRSHGGCVRGQAVQRDGEVLLPCYGEIDGAMVAHVLASQDGCLTWAHRGLIARSETLNFYEPSLTLCVDGSLVAWLRTDDEKDRIASVRSADGGHSWGDVQVHQAVGHPCHGLRLQDGRIFLSYGYRHEGFGVRARVLAPQGDNVDSAAEIILRSDGPGCDLGYPWAVELENGNVLTAYYFTSETGLRHIAYSIVEL